MSKQVEITAVEAKGSNAKIMLEFTSPALPPPPKEESKQDLKSEIVPEEKKVLNTTSSSKETIKSETTA